MAVIFLASCHVSLIKRGFATVRHWRRNSVIGPRLAWLDSEGMKWRLTRKMYSSTFGMFLEIPSEEDAAHFFLRFPAMLERLEETTGG